MQSEQLPRFEVAVVWLSGGLPPVIPVYDSRVSVACIQVSGFRPHPSIPISDFCFPPQVALPGLSELGCWMLDVRCWMLDVGC